MKAIGDAIFKYGPLTTIEVKNNKAPVNSRPNVTPLPMPGVFPIVPVSPPPIIPAPIIPKPNPSNIPFTPLFG